VLEKHVAETGDALRESQLQALERKNEEQQAMGKLRLNIPATLAPWILFMSALSKALGVFTNRLMSYLLQSCKVADAKLYTSKTPITAADLLNGRVLPFYEEHELPVFRILTDLGTEYCGKPEHHQDPYR